MAMALYKKTKYDVRGGIFGFAIGDALGVPVKGVSRTTMEWYPVRDFELCRVECPYSVAPGTFSANTSLVLALMDSLASEKRIDLTKIMACYANYSAKSKYSATKVPFGLNRETKRAIESYLEERRLKFIDDDTADNTNGALIRILPIAFVCHAQSLDRLARLRLIKDVSSLTHTDSINTLGCLIYVDFIDHLLSGQSIDDAYQAVREDPYWSFTDQTRSIYRRMLSNDLSKRAHAAISSGEYIADTLKAALWSLLTTHNFRDAVLTAANLGHDANSVAALTGSMAGIVYGFNEIPRTWKDDLERCGMVQKMSDRFAKSLQSIRV